MTVFDPLVWTHFLHPARRVKNPAPNLVCFHGLIVDLCDAKPHESFDRVRTLAAHWTGVEEHRNTVP